jgi:phenylalanyl-tRNA synthetase beta chain
MKVPLSWLRDFVDVPGTADEIARTMSVRGFAVEGIERVAAIPRPGRAQAAMPAAVDDDAVIDFEVTANRPDCMSVAGLAREVATAFALPLREPGSAAPGAAAEGGGLVLAELARVDRGDIEVVIEDPDLCARYMGAVATVGVAPSPDWMQARLQAAGVRPISNIVDITNYVLLELGHPMHAFDLRALQGAQIRVRSARQGETLRTLDGQDRTLGPAALVIADAARAVAVAGVMGGADSEVVDSTTAIVFESACFNPLSVRRTSRRMGLKTEASMRFERGADPNLASVAMARACALLDATGAGRAGRTVVDAYPLRTDPSHFTLRRERISALLGAPIPDVDVERILTALGFALEPTPAGWAVTVPTRRVDVRREVDLIEEVARHHGFDRLPATFPILAAPPAAPDPRIAQARGLRTVLTGAGFSEAVTFGFIEEAAAAPFAAEGDLMPIANPLSATFGVLRPSVLPGLVGAVAHNRRRERRDIRLFEVGNRFHRGRGERRAVACAWTGAAVGDHWGGGARDVDFFDIKGIVERLCEALRVQVHVVPHREEWLVNGRTGAVLHDGVPMGVFGQLRPAIADARGVPEGDAVYVAELDLDAVDASALSAPVAVTPLPRFPSVTRDVSILVDDTLPAEEVRRTIRAAAPASLASVREFDRYQGKGVPDGRVSLSVRLTFRSVERTLTDAEVQSAAHAIVTALVDEHGAVQR